MRSGRSIGPPRSLFGRAKLPLTPATTWRRDGPEPTPAHRALSEKRCGSRDGDDEGRAARRVGMTWLLLSRPRRRHHCVVAPGWPANIELHPRGAPPPCLRHGPAVNVEPSEKAQRNRRCAGASRKISGRVRREEALDGSRIVSPQAGVGQRKSPPDGPGGQPHPHGQP
jgi:hypothetical protein